MNTEVIEVSGNPAWSGRRIHERRALLFAERQSVLYGWDHVSAVAFAWGLKRAVQELSLVQVTWLDDVSESTMLVKMVPKIAVVTCGRLPTTPMLKRFRDDADRLAIGWGHYRTVYTHWFYVMAEHLDLYSVVDCAQEFKRKIIASIPCPTEYFHDWNRRESN